MDELSFEIGKNMRKYRKLKGLTLENCTDNQLVVALNILKNSIPFIKE